MESVLDGTDLILSVGDNALGYSTGCKVTTSAETGERVTKEAASGKWKEKYVKSFSEQISADGCVLRSVSSGMPTYDELKSLMLAGEPVGMLDVFNFDPMNSRVEIGVFVGAEHRCSGVGETAVRIATENYCFGRLNLHQVYCTVRCSNAAALALFRSAGFADEVVLKDWLSCGNGTFEDAVMLRAFSRTDK